MRTMEVAQFCSTSHVVIVAGKGGVGKTTVTAALAVDRGARRSQGARRRGRGQIGAARDVRRRRPSATTRPTSHPASAPASSRPTQALVDYLETHGMKRISKRLAASGALDVVATAVPGHEGHPRARQGEVARGGRARRPHHRRRARRRATRSRSCSRARGLLDAVRVGPIRKQAHGRRRAALRSRPLPGAARHAARGDAGERGDRHRVRDRGPRRRRARTDRRERLLPAAARGCRRRRPTRSSRDADAARPVRVRPRGRRPRARGRVPRTSATTSSTSRSSGSSDRLPLPQIQSAVRVHARHPPAEVDVLADALARRHRGGCEHHRGARRRERHVVICCGSGGVGKTTTAAVLALEGARRGRNACVVTIDPAKRLADALGLEQLSDTPQRDRPRPLERRRRRRRAAACPR